MLSECWPHTLTTYSLDPEYHSSYSLHLKDHSSSPSRIFSKIILNSAYLICSYHLRYINRLCKVVLHFHQHLLWLDVDKTMGRLCIGDLCILGDMNRFGMRCLEWSSRFNKLHVCLLAKLIQQYMQVRFHYMYLCH